MNDTSFIQSCSIPVELLQSDLQVTKVNFQDNQLRDIHTNEVVGKAMRLIHDGRVGTACGGIRDDASRLFHIATDLSRYGRTAAFSLPEGSGQPWSENYIPADISGKTVQDIRKLGKELIHEIEKALPGWTIHAYFNLGEGTHHLVTSRGIDWCFGKRSFQFMVILVNAQEGDILEIMDGRASWPTDDQLQTFIEELTATARRAETTITIPQGTYPVVIHPMTLGEFLAAFEIGLNGKSIHDGLSPLQNRTGELIFNRLITMVDDPTEKESVEYDPMGSEGVMRERLPIVTQGRLQTVLTNLEYAARLGIRHTGHGKRFPDFNSEGTPSPEAAIGCGSWIMESGPDRYETMISQMKKGILLLGCWDIWSNSLINGDVSGSTHLAFYIENGEIMGRVKDMRISGNIYDFFGKNLIGVSQERPQTFNSSLRAPYLMVDGVDIV